MSKKNSLPKKFFWYSKLSLSLFLTHTKHCTKKSYEIMKFISLFNLQSSELILIVQTSAVPTQKSMSTRWVAENDLDLVMLVGLRANAFTVKK